MRRTGMMLAGSVLALAALVGSEGFGGEPHSRPNATSTHPRQIQWFSGTYLDPALQRPDIFPHILWNSIPEHRRVYNRPRYATGKLLFHIEPTSQEAMAWETNVRNGNYKNHRGPYVPMYWYPKPWEALNTRARPDFVKQEGVAEPVEAPTLMELVEPASR